VKHKTPTSARKTRSAKRAARRIKLGIDVGGTFTHAVALDAASLELVGKAVVPTTHTSKSGVAEGVVRSIERLLEGSSIRPREVILVAHSTTQATNALLEGDVARVGVLGMSPGRDVWRARGQSDVGNIELAPGKAIRTCHRFVDTSRGIDEGTVRGLVGEMLGEGAEVFAVSEAYGIEDPERERRVAEMIRAMGHPATAASELSELYGLRVRTRTAVINACMLPKMLETADMTERSVREMGIAAPLMIMRSDGGIMTIDEMRRRPILTMLSGPAAGVAAALMFLRISDGLFFEVGGTSTDVSLIRNGRPMVRSAEVGGHRLYVRTLDIRTVGIGGGSMVRAKRRKIVDVGPRSAHIAGLRYPSFAREQELGDPQFVEVRPHQSDPDDYLAVSEGKEAKPVFALTTTDAANVLGVPRGYAMGVRGPVDRLARSMAAAFGRDAEVVAEEILELAAKKVEGAGRQFIREYKLDPALLVCVGGGGGAEVIVPPVARRLGMQHSIAANAEVISAIGVALGMIRDTIERSIASPSAADILRIRSEAEASVARMGASPDSIDVFVEVDTRQRKLLATATGVPELRTGRPAVEALPAEELRRIAAASCGLDPEKCEPVASTGFYSVFRGTDEQRRLLGLLRRTVHPIRVLDREGIVRLKCSQASVLTCSVRSAVSDLGGLIDEATTFGDAGGLEPDVYVLVGHRIIDLTGLVGKEQMLSLLRTETERFAGTETAVVLAARKKT
jgi:N-methylhydantoinase A/oxoprolinase/acetone carboxylase beta subunit